MDKIKYIRPSIEHKDAAIDFIKEFYEHSSAIEGVNGLHRFLDKYEMWLNKIEVERNNPLTSTLVPSETFFIIREKDNMIIGMATLRLGLNHRLKKFGGNIGASIRPTERGKGYGKAQLYMALKVFDSYDIDSIMLDCDKKNLASSGNIKALGGILMKEEYLEDLECTKQDYYIDVKKSLLDYEDKYGEYVDASLVVNENSKGGRI